MSRARTLDALVPLAAAEPDGLLVTSTGAYVRLLECEQVLQPLRGGCEHRAAIREQLAALAAQVPAGQRLQILVEAEPLHVDAELAGDWEQIAAAADAAERHGDSERAEAMRRLGYGLEQTIRRSAPAVQAARLRWTVATCWRRSPASVRQLLERARPQRVRTLDRRTHERAAADSLRFTDSVLRELTGAGCNATGLDGPAALTALARTLRPGAQPDRDGFAGLGARA